MSVQPDHYALLGLQTRRYDAVLAVQDVKDAYKRALLLHHPDKSLTNGPSQPTITVDSLTLAYKTLSDPSSRAEYDRARIQDHGQSRFTFKDGTIRRTGLETVDLDALTFVPDTQLWTRSCRCGDSQAFVVSEFELEKHADDGELTVGCKGCSLWLRVLFSVEGQG